MSLPPKKKSNVITLQPNRDFDTEAELRQWVESNHPKGRLKCFWPVQVLRCEIEIPKE